MSVTVVSLSTSCLVKYAPKNWQGARWHSAARVTDSTARVTARSNAFPPELSSHARTHASLCLRGRIRVLASKHSCLVCVLTWFVCAVAGGSVMWRSGQRMRESACSLDACDRRVPHTALTKNARANKTQRRRDAQTQRRSHTHMHRPTHTRVPGARETNTALASHRIRLFLPFRSSVARDRTWSPMETFGGTPAASAAYMIT